MDDIGSPRDNADAEIPELLLARFSEVFFSETGIRLGLNKRYLFETRLRKLRQRHPEIRSWADLNKGLRQRENHQLMSDFVNLLVTNYSYFLRDPVHFRFLRYYLARKYNPEKKLNIWSAACAKGEEAYSIAITVLLTLIDPDPEKISILGTDISRDVLQKAVRGEFRRTLIAETLDNEVIDKFFEPVEGDMLRVNDSVKSFVRFRQYNLLDRFPGREKFGIVFLRNVLIYFSNQEKEQVLENIAQQLEPGGYLILGNSETLVNLKHRFTLINHNIFRLKNHRK